MENQKKVVNFEREMKKAQIKAWFRSKANSAANWLNENKETIIVLGPVAIGAVTTLVKVVGKNVNLRKGIIGVCAVNYQTLSGFRSIRGRTTENGWLTFSAS